MLYAFCFIGCVYHVISISLVYFTYETVTRVTENLITHLMPPKSSLCIDYHELINLNAINKTLLTTSTRPTVRDVFNLTPNLAEQIIQCQFRVPNSFDSFSSNSSDCLNHFIIDKFLIGRFLCYRITLSPFNKPVNESEKYDYRIIADALVNKGTFFTLHLNNEGFRFNTLFIVAYFGSYPYYSSKFTFQMTRELDVTKNSSRYNLFTSYFRFNDVTLLPKPYDTMCTDTLDAYRVGCYEDCMDKRLEPLKRVPFMNVRSKAIDWYQFDEEDFKNDTLKMTLEEANQWCYSSCNQNDCRTNFSLTRIVRERGSPEEFVITSAVPTEPSRFSVSCPKISPIEYIIYLSSALGLWFGFNVSVLVPRRKRHICGANKGSQTERLNRKSTF